MMMAAGETKEIGSDNSRHLTHHDGVPTYSTQFRRVSFTSCDHPLHKEVDKISNSQKRKMMHLDMLLMFVIMVSYLPLLLLS